jgi:hypothetical protein
MRARKARAMREWRVRCRPSRCVARRVRCDGCALGAQVVEDGYEFFGDRTLVTVFSAPNYCGEFDNCGAMMSVDESLMCSFQVRAASRSHHTHPHPHSTWHRTTREPHVPLPGAGSLTLTSHAPSPSRTLALHHITSATQSARAPHTRAARARALTWRPCVHSTAPLCGRERRPARRRRAFPCCAARVRRSSNQSIRRVRGGAATGRARRRAIARRSTAGTRADPLRAHARCANADAAAPWRRRHASRRACNCKLSLDRRCDSRTIPHGMFTHGIEIM